MSQVNIMEICPDRRLIGEGPHWLEKSQSLVYVDIPNGTAHRYFPETKRHQTLHIDEAGTGSSVGFIIPVDDRKDEFVVGIGTTLASVKWSPEDPDDMTQKPNPLVSVDQDVSRLRFNDAKCDPAGRLWAGTMSLDIGPDLHVEQTGTLYRIDHNLKSTSLLHKVLITNGLAWTADKKTLYFIDSLKYRVDAYEYNHTSGSISNRRVVIDFKASGIEAFPDGMAIDTDGHLWVACYGASQVICVDPVGGKVIRKVEFPSCPEITSCCWGGRDYDTLFVTSAGRYLMSEESLKKFPDAGKTFAVTGLGAKGLFADEFRIDDTC